MDFKFQCDILQAAGLDVLYPGTETYETRDESYFSVSARLGPNCIVQPTSAEQTALAVTTLKKKTCNWAVRGGGHMTWAGASNSKFERLYLATPLVFCTFADVSL